MEHFYALILTYKYHIILPISIIEGPAISIISGALVATGHLNPFAAYVVLVLGDLIGDTLYYFIGRFFGLSAWLLKFIGERKNKVVSIENIFKDNGAKLLFFGKLQGLGAVVLVAAGVIRYPYDRFMTYNTIATLVKTFILLSIGYYFSRQYLIAGDYITKIGVALTFVFVLVLYIYFRKEYKAWKQ